MDEVRAQQASPVLPTADLRRTKEWYERHLGFRAGPRWEEWNYLILHRDGVMLHFRPHNGAVPEETGSFYLYVTGDIDALAARMKEEGADIHDLPRDQPYGVRDFTAHDPDGRHVVVGRLLEAR
jgi:catechol 2,3-dioxygenase-like lactoylglutathione lyase family enzyme